MKLANLFGFLVKLRGQPKRLPEPCPICRRPMKREGFVRRCPTGHQFIDARPKRKRPYTENRILNEGDYTGEI